MISVSEWSSQVSIVPPLHMSCVSECVWLLDHSFLSPYESCDFFFWVSNESCDWVCMINWSLFFIFLERKRIYCISLIKICLTLSGIFIRRLSLLTFEDPHLLVSAQTQCWNFHNVVYNVFYIFFYYSPKLCNILFWGLKKLS